MEETTEFARNTPILITGELITFALSFGVNFFLIRFLSIGEYSNYNRVLVIPTILVFISDFGLYRGSSYYIARFNKSNNKQKSRNIIKITLISKSLIGLSLSLFLYFLAENIISPLIGIQDPDLINLFKLASLLLISKSLLEAVLAVLVGSSKMKVFALVKIILNGTQFAFTILLIQFGWKLFGPVMGLIFSTGIAGVFGLFYIQNEILTRDGIKEKTDWKCLPLLMKRGFFFSLNTFLSNTKNEFFILFLTIFAFYSEVSYLRVGVSITIVFNLFLRPVTISLFPIFSKYSWDDSREKMTLTQVFHHSIKFCNLFISPIIIFCVFFASELIPLVFGFNYLASSQFIAIFLISYLPLTIGMVAIPTFFFGQGHPRLAFIIDFISLISSILFGILFSIILGSLGFAIGISLGAFLGIIFGIFATNRIFGKELFSKNKKSILIIVIAGLLCGFLFISYYLFTQWIVLENPFLKLLILGLVFVCYYILFLIILIRTKLVRYDEMAFFIQEFQNIPVINRILRFIAVIAKIILKEKSD